MTEYLDNGRYLYTEGTDRLEYWTRNEGLSESDKEMFVKYNGRKFKILEACEVGGETYPLTIIIDCDKPDWFAGMPTAVAGMIWNFFYGNEWDLHEVLNAIRDYLGKNN